MTDIKEGLLLRFTYFLRKGWQVVVLMQIHIIKTYLKNYKNRLLKNFKKRTVYSGFKDNIWRADLAELQLISNFNKRSRFSQCVTDIFSKYAWVVPLKDKKGVSNVNVFQIIIDDSNRKASKVWVDKNSEFYKSSFKNGYKIMILKCIRYMTIENLLLLKNLLGLQRLKSTNT